MTNAHHLYDIRSAMLNIGIVFTPGKFKINLEKTWKTPGILVNLRSTDPVRLAPMWQQSGTLLFCSCHGIAGFLVDELQI